MTKYGNKKCMSFGHKFDSIGEMQRYLVLREKLSHGDIEELELQPVYHIEINGINICKVILDFRYYDVDSMRTIIEDFKGMDTAISRLKRKMVEAAHNIKVEVIKNNQSLEAAEKVRVT